jgi:hypothetical protein
MMRLKSLRDSLLLVLFAALAAACTEEDPTDIGGPLVPSGNVVTYEVILSPDQYLEFDTAFGGYVKAGETTMKLIARNFEGVLNANSLVRYGGLPTVIQVRDTGTSTVIRPDSAPQFSGYLLIRVDTARSRGAGRIGVYRAGEHWDPASATWSLRVDTGAVELAWQQPGGTKGAAVGTVAWSGADTLTIPLDSATIRYLATPDSAGGFGVVIGVDQSDAASGSQLHLLATTLRISAKSRLRADTTIAINVEELTSQFVFTPDPPSLISSTPRVSGVPAWRTVLGLKPLKNLTVSCPGTGCTIALNDAHIHLAELLLQPTASPAGFSPEDGIVVQARALLETAGVPLLRSPIVDPPLGATRIVIPRTRFTATDTTSVGLPLTGLISALVADTATLAANSPPRRVALLTNPEASTFGIASFKPGPRLRLVLTISRVE